MRLSMGNDTCFTCMARSSRTKVRARHIRATGATEQAAKDAIAAAKKANKDAKAVGYEWRDTGKLIKKAEKALADEDYAKAIKLANKAKRQAESAIAQERSERGRLADMFGEAPPPPLACNAKMSDAFVAILDVLVAMAAILV